jgi:hypothetical protein
MAKVDSVGWKVKNPKGVEEALGVSSRLARSETLDRRRGGGVLRKEGMPVLKADEGRVNTQRASWHTSEGEKVKRASAWSSGNTRVLGTDSPPDQGSEVGVLAYSRSLQFTFPR